MAQLKDTIVSGSLRATDSLLTTTLQTQILKLPTASNGTTYGPGSNGHIIFSNGSSTYWGATTGITALGTVTTGTWSASTIAVNKGGTGQTSWTQWGVLYASASTTLANTGAGTAGYLLQSNASSAPSWIQATNANTASTIVKRDASGNFSAGTITASLSGNATSATKANSLLLSRITESANHLPDTNSFIIREYNNTSANLPTANWFHIYEGKGSDAAYGTQLALGMSTTALYYRNYSSSAWSAWQRIVTNSGTWGINVTGAARYLENRGGSAVTVVDDVWAHGHTPANHTNQATVWHQRWKQSGITYTPSGGSATTLTDSGDLVLWLSSHNAYNTLQLNMAIDGDFKTIGSVVASNWFRSIGATGWYNQTNGGGWYMNDTTYLRLYGNKQVLINSSATASSTNKSSQLIVSSVGYTNNIDTTGASAVAIELWRGGNASWQIINDGGNLHFKNNWTTAKQTTYTQDSVTIAYNTGNTSIAGTLTAGGDISTTNGLLKSTKNSNTVTIGSQNTSFCHIYNSASIPFIFNNTVETTSGNLGTTAYPWNNLYIGKSDGAGIYYTNGTTTMQMIRFLTGDSTGHGIQIDGGGAIILGSGESAGTVRTGLNLSGATEQVYITSDNQITFLTAQQDGYNSAAKVTIDKATVWAGVDGDTTYEAQVGVQAGSGRVYLASQAASGGTRGLYATAHGTATAGKFVVSIDTNNNATFNGTATYANALKNLGRLANANITRTTNGGVQFLLASSTMTSNKPAGDGFILHFHWDGNESNAWDSQLFITDTHTGKIQWRSHSNATTWGTNWHTILDDTTIISGSQNIGEHNANNITMNGFYYYSSNGPTTDTNFFKSTDGAIFCQAYSGNWVALIAQDYRNGSLAVRGRNNGTWSAWVSIPKMAFENYSALLPASGENGWIKIGTANTSYGLLPSQGGSAGNGHNYLGTSSWYWKYAYIDNIYGTLNGNATSATQATQDGSGNTITTTYLKQWSAGTGSTNAVIVTHSSTGSDSSRGSCIAFGNGNGTPWFTEIQYGYSYARTVRLSDGFGATSFISATQFAILSTSWDTVTVVQSPSSGGPISSVATASANQTANGTNHRTWLVGNSVTGAVWNDYAENRETIDAIPGQCVYELGNDTLAPTTERLQHFAGIVSDTWGFSQGETETAKSPIAVAGRVLAYTYRSRNEYKPGDVLCAAPGGTVDIMTREEVQQYPDRIVGTVSCVPDYEIWGGGKDADRAPVDVDGRIWVKVR